MRDLVEDIYELSPLQDGMLFHTILAPHSGVYLEQVKVAWGKALNVQKFREAWQDAVDDNEILRTSFHWRGLEHSAQAVHRTATLPFAAIDLSKITPAERDRRILAFIQQDAEAGFDMGRAPLLRLAVFRLHGSRHQIVITFHHILLDGWSFSLLLKEISERYSAKLRERDPVLVDRRPYRDYIQWLGEQRTSEAADFWRCAFRDWEPAAPLPLDRVPREARAVVQDQSYLCELSAELSARLRGLAVERRCTVNSIVQAAWSALLARLTDTDDVTFGAVVSGRPPTLTGVEEMVGLFINTLPVRVSITASMSCAELIARIQEFNLAMREFEFASLTDIHGWSELPRHVSLFDTVVVFENYPMAQQGSADASAATGTSAFERTNYSLAVMWSGTNTLSLRVLYPSQLFDAVTVESLVARYVAVLEGVVADPGCSVWRLPWLSAAERRAVVEAPNVTEVGVASGCVHEVFAMRAAAAADAVAVVGPGGQLSFGELERAANRLAWYLRDRGVRPGVVVGVCCERSCDLVVALLGVLKAGGAYLPLDPLYPVGRLEFMVADAAVPVVVTHRGLAGRLGLSGVAVVDLGADAGVLAEQSSAPVEVAVGGEDLAYVIYTSGSTGTPKGVMGTHGATMNRLSWMWDVFPFGAGEVACARTRVSFVDAVGEVFGALLAGVKLVLVPDEVGRDPAQFVSLLRREGVTRVVAVPSLLRIVLESPSALPGVRGVRYWVSSGEPLPVEVAARLRRACPGGRLLNLYGSTEVAGDATFYEVVGEPRGSSVPIGRPIANTRVYVLDRHRQPVPVGVAGELYVGGAGLARGYLNRPELTAERFVPDPFGAEPGGRLYRTGDRVRWLRDGNLEFLGRLDDQVKVRGFRVELGEIEAVLNAHPDVAESAVVAAPDPDGSQRLLGFVVVGDAAGEPAVEQLRGHLRERLPDYMVPSAILALDALPLNPNGKIDRKALAARDIDSSRPARATDAPVTPLEEAVTAAFSQVLGVDRVGVLDDFFALGGHSLLATRVISTLADRFGLDIPLAAIFENPTPQELANELQRQLGEHAGAAAQDRARIPRRDPGNRFPLSFAQRRLWFLDQLVPGSASYNIIAAVRVNVRLDVRAFSRAVNELVRRHESLRTTFGVVEGEPVQVVAPALTVRLEGWDLRGLPAAVREREVVRLATAAARRPFDLTRGPLLRVGVVWLGSSRYVVLVCMHHIVSDGWSMDVFSREVVVLYEAFAAGRPSPLPELEIQYPDFAVWQRQWLTGNVLESQLAYWRRALADLPSLELPTDRPRPKVQSHVGATSRFTVPAELRDAVAGLARGEGATLFMALLAAFGVVLARTADQDDLVVGSPIANRNRVELENLIGFFVNTLVLRVDCSGEPSFLELLSRVREVALGAYAHQDLPFEKLVEELAPERDLGRNPLFQVTFQLFNAPGNGDGQPPATVDVETGSTVFDLSLALWEGPSGLSGRVEYSTDLFDAVTVESLVARYVAVLEGVVADPGCSVWRLPWLSAAERRAVVEAPNVTEVGVASGCVHEVFAMRAAAAADAVAVVGPGGQLSFGELERAANRLAWYLRDRGVRPGVVVGVCCERSCDLVVALLGVLKAGGAYLPLDPLYPVGRLEFMVADAAVPVVVTHRGLAGRLGLSGVAVVDLGADAGVLAEQSSAPVEVAVGGEDLAYVIYTSGSTGTPKGVMIEHGALRNHMDWMQRRFPLNAADRVLQRTSIAFDAAVWEWIAPLLAGAMAVLLDTDQVQDPALLVRAVANHHITRMQLVPSLARLLVVEPDLMNCPTLRYVFVGGELMTTELVAALRRVGVATIVNLYGPTEACIDATFYEVVGEPRGSSVPIGRPIANTRVYVLDRHRQPVPVGVAGELYVGGAGLARGYLNRPELTAERFVPDPFGAEPGGRLYRTGDRVRWLRDGNLEFLGRLDDQVKVRGFRVELGEIEAVLNAHPDVAESAVVAAPGPDGSQRLLGFVVLGDAAGEPAVEQLRGHLRERLPDYMVPSAILALDALPLNPNGKIDRRVLAKRQPSRIHEGRRLFEAPGEGIESQVAALFREVLGCARVGRHDEFFAELGGHSLLATQLASRIRERLAVDLPLRAVFEHPTVAGLGAYVAEARSAATPAAAERIGRSPRVAYSGAGSP